MYHWQSAKNDIKTKKKKKGSGKKQIGSKEGR